MRSGATILVLSMSLLLLAPGCSTEEGLPLGSTCAADSDCASGHCHGMICRPLKAPNNAGCMKDEDCKSHKCDDLVTWKCVQGDFSNNAACLYHEECMSGFCDGASWKCANPPPDAGDSGSPDVGVGADSSSCECQAGAKKTEPCGNCNKGTQAFKCGASCKWETDGTCQNEGTCAPTQTTSCGYCGTKTCSSSCTWESCTGEGCKPSSTKSCGYCGKSTCSSSCAWGSCTGEGCKPSSTKSCGYCGKSTCSSSCTWGSCTGEGCKPGSTKTANCSCGNTKTSKCSSSCTWGAYGSCTSNGWEEYLGKCYRLIAIGKTQADADKNCAGHGGRLADLCTDGERNFVYNNFCKGSFYFWLGGYKYGSTFKWQTGGFCGGNGISSSWWNSGEPSGDGACVEMLTNGKLNDAPCSSTKYFVCEVNGSSLKP